jgi:membrane protein YdbS with pleckstrin-like domain
MTKPDHKLQFMMDENKKEKVRRTWLILFMILGLGISLLILVGLEFFSGWINIFLIVSGLVCVFIFIFFVSTTKYGQWRHGHGPNFWY